MKMADMQQTSFSALVEIAAPPQLVWSVMSEVERWPEWTANVSRLKLLTSGPLRIGSRAQIHQPGFPPAWWRVTELEVGNGFTWVSVAPGLCVKGKHWIEPAADGCHLSLSIRNEGLFGLWLARWTRDANDRYLVMEAHGLHARCMELAAPSYSRIHEAH